MISRQKITYMLFVILHLVGCADFATPVTVLPPKPEHQGTEPNRIGVACAHKIFWVISFGDSRFREAKKNGGVKDVATVEVLEKFFPTRYFPFNVYQRQCTEVAGYS